jgi:cob(I)alamin adenosyltransferase
MKIYTRRGDDGSTGLLHGGRVPKSSPRPTAYGSVDEAQAAIGVARAAVGDDGELERLLVRLERDLWVLMAELATDPAKRERLVPGDSLVTEQMVLDLEHAIDDFTQRFEPPREFVVPGTDAVSASLDVARTVVRRAERDAIAATSGETEEEGSVVVPYLNRLSDLLWTLARWSEGDALTARSADS